MDPWTTWGQEMDRPMDKRSLLNTVKHVLGAHRKLPFVVLLIHCATTGHHVPPWVFKLCMPMFLSDPYELCVYFWLQEEKTEQKTSSPPSGTQTTGPGVTAKATAPGGVAKENSMKETTPTPFGGDGLREPLSAEKCITETSGCKGTHSHTLASFFIENAYSLQLWQVCYWSAK